MQLAQGALEISDVTKSFGDTSVLEGVSLSVEPGENVALLGPSGCGKTTLLRIIAGLERPNGGTVTIAGRTVAGPSAFVAPERRGVGMVFQDWALFPHLSVERNVAYGLPRSERSGSRARETLALVGMEGFAHRTPDTLSGGQQQRVALARALAPQPSILLLDEPFSNLDVSLRVEVRTELHRLLSDLGIATVFVTHDQQDAFVLGHRVAVLHDGHVEQCERPEVIYRQPATRWVATFVGGAMLFPAEASGATATCALGKIPLARDANGPVEVVIRPELLDLTPATNGDAAAVVDLVEYHGHESVVRLRADDGTPFIVRRRSEVIPERGETVVVRYVGGPTTAFAR